MTSIIPQAKLLNMKLLMKLSTLLLVFGISSTAALAQYDDVYYDPERNNSRTTTDRRQVQPKTTPTYAEEQNYDEGYDDEEYDYYYTSRIRRFHRPYTGFDYFDPIYVDAYYYDAFARPGVTVLIYDDPFGYYSFNRFSRFNRFNNFNSFGGGFNRWNRWNSFGSYDPWFSPGLSFGLGWNRWNNFGGFNNWNSWGGYGNPYYGGNSWFSAPTWGNNYYYNNVNYYSNNNNGNNNDNNRNIYYGPRTGGGGVGTQPGIDNPNGRSPRFTNGPDIKSNPANPVNPGVTRPDYSGGRKLDEAPAYDRDRTVPGAGNPRVITDTDRRTPTNPATPENYDRYRDARENLNRPDYNTTRRPEVSDPFSGGRRPTVQDNSRARTIETPERSYSDPRNSTVPRTNSAPRSLDNGSLERSRSYTPDRSYERSRETPRSYDTPRNTPSPSNSFPRSNNSFDSGRSNSAPRSIDSGGSRSSGGSPSGGSSSPSGSGSSSGGRSSSSGGRQN